MSILKLYGGGDPVMSFEFFPPKTDAGFGALFHTIEDLKRLAPGFVSVTMGAGGTTRSKTVDLMIRIQRELGLTTMAHLPCLGFDRAALTSILDTLEQAGVDNVLALRGDVPQNDPDFVRPTDGFGHANELANSSRTEVASRSAAPAIPRCIPRRRAQRAISGTSCARSTTAHDS